MHEWSVAKAVNSTRAQIGGSPVKTNSLVIEIAFPIYRKYYVQRRTTEVGTCRRQSLAYDLVNLNETDNNSTSVPHVRDFVDNSNYALVRWTAWRVRIVGLGSSAPRTPKWGGKAMLEGIIPVTLVFGTT